MRNKNISSSPPENNKASPAMNEASGRMIFMQSILPLLFLCIVLFASVYYGCSKGNPHYPYMWRMSAVHYDLDSAFMDHTNGNTSTYYIITLYQDYRGYDSLPAKLSDLKMPPGQGIERLSLRGNRISFVPCWLLDKSRRIDLTNNNITVFNPGILQLSWGWIILDSNAISSLPFDQLRPEGLCGTRSWERGYCTLDGLYLNYNNIQKFPDTLAINFSNLKVLSLIGNPIPKAEQERIRNLFTKTEVRF